MGKDRKNHDLDQKQFSKQQAYSFKKPQSNLVYVIVSCFTGIWEQKKEF